MKLIANLVVTVSLLLGQFNPPTATPYVASPAQSADIASATETPTPAATETVPPAATQTATPLPTSTVTSTPEITPSAEPQIALSMFSTPGFVTTGETITVNWAIQGISPNEHTLTLSAILPEGFTLTDPNLRYDETTRTLTIPVAQESGQFDLLADQPAEDALMAATLAEQDVTLAQFNLPLPTHEQFTVDETGGEVTTEDGIVTLTFPEDVLPEETTISVGTPGGEDAPLQSLSGNPIEITATTNLGQVELHQFDRPVTIDMQYSGMNIPEEKLSDLYFYWYNPETDNWEAMVTTIDAETQTISTETTHFSVFDIGINDWQATHLPTVDAFQVSQFTGAGTFSLPIDLPAGPGGLKPNLTLSYNSQVIDQARIDTQASWVGMGWSLDAAAIERDTHGTTSDTGDDTFQLSVAGVSTRLVNMGYGGYQAQDKNFWRIERDNNTDTWTVWDKAGNIYYFGDVPGEDVNATSHMLYRSNDMHELIRQNYRWALRRQQNIFGKYIRYTYTEETKELSVIGVGGLTRTDNAVTAVYPEYIIYPNNQYRLWFEPEARWDFYDGWKTDQAYHNFQMKRLKSLHIQNNVNGVWNTVSRYDFGYAANDSANIIFPGAQAWHPIEQQLGKVTTLISFGQAGLPGYSFQYADKLHLTYAENGYGGSVTYDYDSDPGQVLYQPWYYDTNARLTYTAEFNFGSDGLCGAADGQGGWTALSGVVDCTPPIPDQPGTLMVQGTGYNPITHSPIRPGAYYKLTMTAGGNSPTLGIHDGTTILPGSSSSSLILLPATAKAANPVIQSPGTAYVSFYKMQLLQTYYRVNRKTISDGTHSYTYTYTYAGPAVNDTDHSLMAQACYPNQVDCNEYNEELSEFRGHASVTETAPDGRQVKTTFWQDDARKGQPISVETRDAANVLMNSRHYTYGVTSADISFWSYYHIQGFKQYWVYTDTEENRTYNNDGATYTYTISDNNYESTYGNLVSTAESSSLGLYRTTTIEYAPNNGTPYLVGLPARQTITNGSGTLIAETWSLYDDHTSYSSQPSNGKLTGQRTLVSCINNDCTSTSNRRYSDVEYAYDSWGNRTTVTAYKGDGLWSSLFTGTTQTTYTCYGELDSVDGCGSAQNPELYFTYPLWTQNAKGQTTYVTYDYAKGVPITETDPNGARTTADYDEFGRIRHVYLPDPNQANTSVSTASLEMQYTDGYPFTTSITQHVNGSSFYTITRLYDGMGRQTETIGYPGTAVPRTVMIGTSYIFTNTNYPTFITTQQSAPHLSTETARYTISTSDLNARTSTVTAPDGTSTVTYTNGLTSTVTDPRGNVTTSVKDVWGRTLSVTPPTGPAVSYTYDEQGNLMTASRGGVITYLTYNQVGQKIAMTDPDMGGWTYNYDALGNMTSQTDARGCTLAMTYDALSRMTGKSSSGACGTQVSATYTYDIGTNGIGRRTSTVSNGITNSWTYDKRGRVVSETVQDGNLTPYTTSYDYNLADMPTDMTYPGNGGEHLKYTYDELKRLESLKNTDNYYYVQSSIYDASSRLTDRTLGNGLTQKFTYNSWTSEGGRLDNITSGTWNGSSFTSTLQNLDYTYDASGNITRIYDTINTETQTFTYDTLDRLTSAKASGASQGAYNETYTYDPITGNLQARGDTSATNDPGTSGLAAKWSLDETSGQRSDSQGFSHVSPSNTVGYALGHNGNAASFSSTTPGVLTHTDNSQLSTGDIDFTLVASFYPASSSGVAVLVNKGVKGDANTRDYALIQSNSTIIFTVGRGSTNASVSASFNGVNTWHTVVAWHDSVNNTINIQIDNGTPTTASYSGGASDSTSALSIGGHADSTYIFNGRIDEVSLYKRILSANERTWLFNPGLGNLVSWWTMNETSGQRNDSHSNNHLSVTGTVTSATGRPTSTNAASFSSSPTGILTRADNAQLSTGDIDFTLSANFYATSVSGVTVLVNKGSSTDQNQRDYALIQSNNMLLFRVGNGSTNASVTSATFTANTWHTVVAWHDSVNNTLNIQIDNGTPTTASYSGGAMDTTYPLSIGGHANSTYVFNGRIDEVSLYKRVLNANERTWLYNAGAGRTYTDLSGTPAMTNTVSYSYDADHAHAVSALADNQYQYDANGNMISRHVLEGTTFQDYTLFYDAENRLVQVNKNGSIAAQFTFDADGKRVKSVMGAETILFVGAHYEVKNGSEITKYYMAGSTRIAMRKYTIPQNMTVEYLLSDHLGSTSLTADADGNKVLEIRYKAWGEIRATWTSSPSTTPTYKMPLYQYTGQASYMDDPLTSGVTEGFGLMFYNARWYDPYLNHFSQPDSIVPDPYNSQDYDRYSYARNNPIRYNDPSGHMVWDGDEGTNTCNDPDFCENGQVKPYAGIAYTLRLARSARNGEERGWYYNRAFYLTISQFDIAIPYDENHPLHISLGGIDSSWNDPTTPAGTYYTPVTPDYPEGSPDIRINIYNAAFESTPGDLAATISHEFCHANQASGTGCSTNPPTTGERWYTSGIGGAVNEIEARQAVLSNLSAYGYGTTYGITQGKIDQYNIDISSLRNQYDPYPDFYNAITTQVYTLPY